MVYLATLFWLRSSKARRNQIFNKLLIFYSLMMGMLPLVSNSSLPFKGFFTGMSPWQKSTHTSASKLVCVLICAPKLAYALIYALTCALVCASKLICALVCASKLAYLLFFAPKFVHAFFIYFCHEGQEEKNI